MALTCVVCRRQINTIGELADHISDTSQREEVAWTFDDIKEMVSSRKESERHSNISRGFAHTRYLDNKGKLLPADTATVFYVTMMAGAKWCVECREDFANNYRMYEHYLDTQHGLDDKRPERAKEHMEDMKALEAKWFYPPD